MQLSIVIVSYNVCAYLLQCLDAVGRATRGIASEVWVVDNASTDDSVARVRERFPEVLMLANKENVGFARANNMALRQASGEYVLLLNPDTVVAEDTLRQCLNFLRERPEVGAVGARMLNRDGTFAPESRRGLPTPATAFFKLCGLARLFPKSRLFGRYHMRYLDEDKPAAIDVISGAFFMGRRKALEEVGFLDEDYFMYGEDVDLSYRLLCSHWQNWYVPADVLHYKGESTQKTSYRYVHNFYNAMLIFFRKHFASRYRLTALVVYPVVVAAATAEITLRNLRQGVERLCYRARCMWHGGDETWHREVVSFAGDDEEWRRVQAQVREAGMTPHRDFSEKTTYMVYDAGMFPYSDMLRLMRSISKCNMNVHIGIYHREDKTIVLPNDIIR